MDLTAEANPNGVVLEQKETEESPLYVSMVDPFLVEALQNPRHRLTILRMELDIQKFLQNPDLHQFDFPHFPTSYLRLAAHRVAQHYGLQTMVQDNTIDGQGIKIRALKKPDSMYPSSPLSEIPAKESENEKFDQTKVVIKPRPKSSSNDANLRHKRSPIRSVEERKEEYDRARARIFSSSVSSESEDSLDGSSRVAILRDREKDLIDPDYDRNYGRYVRNVPITQNFSTPHFNMPKFQPPFVPCNSVYPHLSQMPAPQASFNYICPPVMSPYCAMGLNQNALYMQWPTQNMMYAHSYDQMTNAFIKAPFCQQPLSFDCSQNHR